MVVGDTVTQLHSPLSINQMIGHIHAAPCPHLMEQSRRLMEKMSERRREKEGERDEGCCVLIDLWSQRLCPLICRAEEKVSGLRCF